MEKNMESYLKTIVEWKVKMESNLKTIVEQEITNTWQTNLKLLIKSRYWMIECCRCVQIKSLNTKLK